MFFGEHKGEAGIKIGPQHSRMLRGGGGKHGLRQVGNTMEVREGGRTGH